MTLKQVCAFFKKKKLAIFMRDATKLAIFMRDTTVEYKHDNLLKNMNNGCTGYRIAYGLSI